MSSNYAIFIASTWNYLMYTNALLNSIEKRKLYKHKGCKLDVYLFYDNSFSAKYIQDIQSKFSFNVIPVLIEKKDIDLPGANHKEFIKRVRYAKIREVGLKYDVVCLLDADMFFTSYNFINLFDLVKGTDKMIACNERYKWEIGDNYFFRDTQKPFLEKPNQKLYKMICNVPSILDMKKWVDVFDDYCYIAKEGRQYKNGDTANIHGIGDLYCWSIAIQRQNRQWDVTTFPMETMTQVHRTHLRPFSYVQVDNGYWHTFAGDEIYVIHGRVAQANFVEGSVKWTEETHYGLKDLNKITPKIAKGLRNIWAEWYDLNFNWKTILTDYTDKDEIWESFKG